MPRVVGAPCSLSPGLERFVSCPSRIGDTPTMDRARCREFSAEALIVADEVAAMDGGGVGVAVVQCPPVLLDRTATLAAAVDHLHPAADAKARLVVFPETYVPGDPVWIWRLRPEADYEVTSVIHRELLANSIDLAADGLRSLRDAAAERGVVVVCGIHEREGAFSRATLYNTLV